jgi:hypothetical protein
VVKPREVIVGQLDLYLYRIPEARLDGLMEYFSEAESDPGRIAPDLEAFLQTFPAGDAAAPRPLGPEARAAYVEQVVARFHIDQRYPDPRSKDGWREYAVYDGLKDFSTWHMYLGSSLPEDLRNHGEFWPILDDVCESREDQKAADLIQTLMLDGSCDDFLPYVHYSSAYLALLRPAEARRVIDAIPLLERFHAALPVPAELGTPGTRPDRSRWGFWGELRTWIGEMKRWGDEPTCLVSSAETS